MIRSPRRRLRSAEQVEPIVLRFTSDEAVRWRRVEEVEILPVGQEVGIGREQQSAFCARADLAGNRERLGNGLLQR